MGNIYYWVYPLGYIGFSSRAKTWIFDADGDNNSNRDDDGGDMSLPTQLFGWEALSGILSFSVKWFHGVRNPIPILD